LRENHSGIEANKFGAFHTVGLSYKAHVGVHGGNSEALGAMKGWFESISC